MPALKVPGATLHYETFGTGPILLLVPGADGRGSVFHNTAKYLASHFTVICWDRRGFSKSFLVGPQDFSNRLSTDADDAELLIRHLSREPAAVFGNSSGAIVAQSLLARHPDCVKAVVVHEPPCLSVLLEQPRTQGTELMQHIYDTYRARGPEAAMEVFTSRLSEGDDDGAMMRHCMDATRGDEIRANMLFWFEFELRQYTGAAVDMAGIEMEKEKYIPAAGIDSGEGGPVVSPIATIAGRLGKKVVRIPGGHVGFMTQPEEFAHGLWEMLKGRFE
ncbi:MAG: hypothetical protein M1834_002368 [Cirrosporium novae-zelandiae]|nr:MAG: hypothetical protein M1834_002368 [Cirrosporium novae-zelandiae]